MNAADDAGAGWLRPGGECDHCGDTAPELIATKYTECGRGPSGTQVGCLPCARRIALNPLAPDWLREDLAAIDAAREALALRVVRSAPEQRRGR